MHPPQMAPMSGDPRTTCAGSDACTCGTGSLWFLHSSASSVTFIVIRLHPTGAGWANPSRAGCTGTAPTFQSPLRMWAVSGRKRGRSPASSRACTACRRLSSSCARTGRKPGQPNVQPGLHSCMQHFQCGVLAGRTWFSKSRALTSLAACSSAACKRLNQQNATTVCTPFRHMMSKRVQGPLQEAAVTCTRGV